MSYPRRSLADHLAADGRPKRILALDGGGLRGILTLGILGRIEDVLAKRHPEIADFRLHHYFDLIAGTSTGAIIAACLAKGMSVAELTAAYFKLGEQVFEKSFFRKGVLRAKYDDGKLKVHLQEILGADTTMASSELRTGLLIVTKRLDTGSLWPLGNNPAGEYFSTKEGEDYIANGEYPLWQVVRASTAAPSFFDPERIVIATREGMPTVEGEFVDGGVSPFNNPSLQALMYATLGGFRLDWKTGSDKLMMVSVGTGTRAPEVSASSIAAGHALQSLVSLMDDCGALVETLMQWLSASPKARRIDGEIGRLDGDLLGGDSSLSYVRYNVDLGVEEVEAVLPGLDEKRIESLSSMDDPSNMEILHRLGETYGERHVEADDFPRTFDLEGAREGLQRYRRRSGTPVQAVRVDLATDGFTYRKWGAEQTCKPGDWLVWNDGDTYTVDQESFARTYREVDAGRYEKVAPIWSERASEAGVIESKEGATHYQAGDYLVYNRRNRRDGYAIPAAKFDQLYVLDTG